MPTIRAPSFPFQNTWNQAFAALGGQDANRAFYRLLGMYSHKRGYHDLTHIERLWRILRQVRPGYQPPPEFIVALFLHDAIYQPGRADSEAQSAALAAELLPQAEPARLARVQALIMATQNHQSDDPALQEFIDLDLAPLGGSEAECARDLRLLQQEYPGVDEAAFLKAQWAVLAPIAARQPLYYTTPFRAAFETAARRNLASLAARAGCRA